MAKNQYKKTERYKVNVYIRNRDGVLWRPGMTMGRDTDLAELKDHEIKSHVHRGRLSPIVDKKTTKKNEVKTND